MSFDPFDSTHLCSRDLLLFFLDIDQLCGDYIPGHRL